METDDRTMPLIEGIQLDVMEIPRLSLDPNDPKYKAAVDAWLASLEDLPPVTLTLAFTPPKRSTEYLLFVETWCPTEDGTGARQRWLDQFDQAFYGEYDSRLTILFDQLGADQQEINRCRGLTRQSGELLQEIVHYAGEALALAMMRPDDPDLADFARRIRADSAFAQQPGDEPESSGAESGRTDFGGPIPKGA